MAASLRGVVCKNLPRFRYFSSPVVNVANALAVSDAEVHYPPIKPRYPPGKYGSLLESCAWDIHSHSSELLAIPRMKERLEKIAGSENRVLWLVEAMDRRPRNVEFKQRLTKTHIINSQPTTDNVPVDVSSAYEQVLSAVKDVVDVELKHQYSSSLDDNLNCATDNKLQFAHQFLGKVVITLLTRLAASNQHLLRSHVDEDVRVETFWCTNGFTGEANECDGRWPEMKLRNNEDAGILTFQYQHRADWQIRTELPLPEFIAMDAPECYNGVVPPADFAPPAVGMTHIESRPITMSGHWIGDPYEFTPVSFHVLPMNDYSELEELGSQYALEAQMIFGVTAGFGSCAAQAYNQGFSYLHDLTYPLTTQCVVTDGRILRIFYYQLNTLRLWIDDGTDAASNPLRNILWASEPVPLYTDDGHGVSEDALKILIRCLLLQPAVRQGVDMRPYLPDEEAPSTRTVYLNHEGDEPILYPKIGRFQYPRNAVYF